MLSKTELVWFNGEAWRNLDTTWFKRYGFVCENETMHGYSNTEIRADTEIQAWEDGEENMRRTYLCDECFQKSRSEYAAREQGRVAAEKAAGN